MKNTVWNAKLIDENLIRVTIFSNISKPNNTAISLVKDDSEISQLTIIKSNNMPGIVVYDLKPAYKITFGHRYNIVIESFGTVALDVNDMSLSDSFDEEYYYDGDDLGATFYPSYTSFVLWAPLAASVVLKVSKDHGKTWHLYEMIREPKGIYRLELDGNYDGAYYNYIVENSGVSKLTIDPYAKGSTANGTSSVVINFKKVKLDLEEDNLPVTKNYTDAVIYETHVRDFTIDDNTNIKNKGKFLGIAEEKRTTNGGNPAGLDYLKYLGITHVQFLPLYDYKTVDELNPDLKYNWGYDPWQYFVPEGSFASELENPYSRIIDLKKMVKALHHNGIKVTADVVYNHVYNYQFHPFEDVVPNYYFRKNANGTASNGSFCGDDLASERKMVAKLIVDACIYWVKEFGIDGYRFDLMGIIDKHTMNRIYRECVAIKPDFMIYGEGWNMPTALDNSIKTTMDNALSLPKMSFFNDAFRDITKGATSESEFYKRGYLTGDLSFVEGFKFAFMGSCINYIFPKKFINANQSINYVECHDNGTLYDKIVACGYEEEKDILRILKLINAVILFSFGVPFFHMGQEIGLSKNMHQNTYNKGDKYNKMRWNIVDERFEYVTFLSSLIKYRKTHEFLREFDTTIIDKSIDIVNLKNNVLKITYLNGMVNGVNKKIVLIINPTNEVFYYSNNNTINFIAGDGGYLENSTYKMKTLMVTPNSFDLFYEEEEK